MVLVRFVGVVKGSNPCATRHLLVLDLVVLVRARQRVARRKVRDRRLHPEGSRALLAAAHVVALADLGRAVRKR